MGIMALHIPAVFPRAQAHRLCPSDPLVCNELGVMAYRARRYEDALSWLTQAVDLVPGGLTPGGRVGGEGAGLGPRGMLPAARASLQVTLIRTET
jgi:hypothetical protein